MSLVHSVDRLAADFAAVERHVRAFVPEKARFARLRREAQALEKRYPDPERRPHFYGTLLGVKDVLHVAGLPTRAGSRLPLEVLQGEEARAVSQLKQAGALVLGKTTTSEFAYHTPTPTRNPHNPAHTPGGSSSGSAAAVASGLCSLALGSQTTGSLIRPAAFCGVYAFKPSHDRISTEGLIPLAPSLDHVGLYGSELTALTRAVGLVCAGWRPAHPPGRVGTMGVPTGPYLSQVADEGQGHFAAVCQRLADAGWRIRRVTAMPDFREMVSLHNLLLAAEAAEVHAEWFAAYGKRYRSHLSRLIRQGQEVDADRLRRARQSREQLRDQMGALMDRYGLDLLLSPAAQGPAPKGLASTGSAIMNLPWTHSGLPTLHLPAGQSPNGLPLGIQVTARWQADEELLAWGVELEPLLPPTQPPKIKLTVH